MDTGRGLLTNMTVSEVEAAKKDPLLPTDTGYVITVCTKLYNEVPNQLGYILNVSCFFACIIDRRTRDKQRFWGGSDLPDL